ncbi:MAG: universal stress protein [Bacteroidales bacterium]|nr:universal stress protein [Bacteroidales bacterium]
MDSKMNNIILVPTDFSEVCKNAMNQAVEAAKFLKYKVTLLHVIDKNTKAQLKKEGGDVDSVRAHLQQMAGEITSAHGIEVDTMSKEGDIFTTIGEVAGEIGARLMYLGTHGKAGLQKLTGSFAIKVVTSSPVPVVVVQKRPLAGGFRKIILPITSDAGPWEKTMWAAFIARNFKATIHIYRLEGAGLDETVKIITGLFDKEGISYLIKNADTGSFSKQVIEYSASVNADMIMIMTNPDKSFTKFILGSYDEEMIFNAAQIPVMCINPRKQNWEKIFDH